jgi:hypothetical protein
MDLLLLHGRPEGVLVPERSLAKEAPAGVEPIETVAAQGAVEGGVVGGGFLKELVKVRICHDWLFLAVHPVPPCGYSS